MRILISAPLLIASLLLVSACARPAAVSEMATGALNLPLPSDSPLKSAMCVDKVSGGTETNPLWISTVDDSGFRSALSQSLRQNGLAAPAASCGYRLSAQLREIDQPLVGFDLEVTADVAYDLVAAQPVFKTNVRRAFTADFSSSLVAAVRLRRANEGAIRLNIETMLRELAASDAAKPAVVEDADDVAPSS